MVCPKCGYEDNDEYSTLIEKKDLDGVNFNGFRETYEVECDNCGHKYKHNMDYEISLWSESDE